MTEIKGVKAVVIGGGTGSFTLLGALKHYIKDITALVNMADDGGSTGILRDELGVLPPGDVRQCLVALSNAPEARDLFNYRFEEGTFAGHAFGNLFMAALEKMTGSFAKGVELAAQVLNITGRVEPMTLTNVTLCMKSSDGVVTEGEYAIGHADFKSTARPKLWLKPKAKLNPAAKQALLDANLIVIAPGNLYGSLAPALLVEGVDELLSRTKAKVVYVCNLVTKPGQTDNFYVHDFANEIERLGGSKFLDVVLYNTATPAEAVLKKYAADGEFGVAVDESKFTKAHYEAVGADLLGPIFTPTNKKDLIPRTLIRHDSDRVARQLMKVYFND